MSHDRSSWSRRRFLGLLPLGSAAALVADPVGRAGALRVSDRLEFDLDDGNAATELVIPWVVPVIEATMTRGAATMILRVTTLLSQAWFDAIAPFHGTAVGVSSRLGRLDHLASSRARNVALVTASVPVLDGLFPEHGVTWLHMERRGLAATDGRDRIAIDVGRRAGEAVAVDRARDGMNQLGDADGRRCHQRPYADTTGYAPANPPQELRDPSRWQPLTTTAAQGAYRSQTFVTPQLGVTRPYSYDHPDEFDVPAPTRSSWQSDPSGYRDQAAEVLDVSQRLTDRQKLSAELFDDKIEALGTTALHVAQRHRFDVQRFVEYDFLANVAAFDATIAVWHNKRRFDAVRPATAIRFLHAGDIIDAWAGPGLGTSEQLGDHWESYLPTADHPEYPSASTAMCHAHAVASQRWFESDALEWSVRRKVGESKIEPGVVPARDLELRFDTWTEFAETCGESRVWGGVHFADAVTAGAAIGSAVAERAVDLVRGHLGGRARRPVSTAVSDDARQ